MRSIIYPFFTDVQRLLYHIPVLHIQLKALRAKTKVFRRRSNSAQDCNTEALAESPACLVCPAESGLKTVTSALSILFISWSAPGPASHSFNYCNFIVHLHIQKSKTLLHSSF